MLKSSPYIILVTAEDGTKSAYGPYHRNSVVAAVVENISEDGIETEVLVLSDPIF